MSSGSPDSAAQRNGPTPRQNSGRIYAGTKPGKSNASLNALLERHLPDVVAVVDGRDASMSIGEHRAHVLAHRRLGGALDAFGIARATLLPLRQGPPLGQVAVDRIVRRCLVGHDVRLDAAAQEFGQDFASIAEEGDRDGFAFFRRPFDDRERVVDVLRDDVDIAGA